jgi:hypothetical protein
MSAPSVKRTTRAKTLNNNAIVTADPPAPNGAASVASAIDPERIALLAYSYWEARGCQGGSPEEDWLRAERQLQTGE